MIPDQEGPATPSGADKFDDEHYPGYTMGRAADMLGTTQGFLRSLDEAGLITPQRSAGGHRRYSRTDTVKVVVITLCVTAPVTHGGGGGVLRCGGSEGCRSSG
ncbi:MerR family DNA-binding transcriptional regulator [Amycolatopsis carbonis]|uniref:MerR family DNA-binding transcriptional regulator n=1 Tax=Amycolatopsis carbonis TaxID=715471 RepID=A0A9Y2MVK5_9PSEU|nr:MerR family DNA-binding transcriptional regulator [Amycolatopsis sp. 2-15]WIX76827.1 MerR family DNA-binding transcriptional regulator [Amycolatopsis sp. 2-15]